jgi:tetratricopeptide (TPR) repeat protein
MEDATQAKLSLARLSLEQDQLDRASQLLEGVLSVDPQHPEALYLLGLIQIITKQPLSESTVQSLLAISPEHASSHFLLGLLNHYVKRNVIGAETSYRKSIRLDPSDLRPRTALARLLGENERLEEAITVAHQALKLSLEDVASFELLTHLYRLNKEHDLASEFAQRGLALDPENATVHREIGLRLLHQRDTGTAIESLRESLRLAPNNASSREEIAHEKVSSHPFFKNGLFLSFSLPTLFFVLLTPPFWWLLSFLFRPFIYLTWTSLVLAVLGYLYHGLFLLCRKLTLCRIDSGRLQ